jgi:hypothetical protein
VLLVLSVVGVVLYLLNTYVPMAPPIKTIINVLVILFVVIWLFSIFFGPMSSWGPPVPFRR